MTNYLSITKSLPELDGKQYGLLMGFYNTLFYAPMTLIIGGYTDKINRKNLIMISCIFGSTITILNAWAQSVNHLIILKIISGFISALFQPASYSLINDLFPKASRTRAFFMYQIFGTMADIITFLTLNLINFVGWRNTYIICGGLGLGSATVGLLLIREPENSVRLQIEKNIAKEK